jgi:nitronate monooxygenase
LTAAVSNFGGLGSFGAHSLSPDAISGVIGEIRALTSRPFAVNLWVSMEDDGARTSDEAAYNRSLLSLRDHFATLGVPLPTYKPYAPARFDDQVRVVLDANVPVFSFIFGVPPTDVLHECRRRKIVTIGTVTTPEEAVALQEAGIDAIAASGFEAGGHRGSFLQAAEDSLTGTFSLVPRIVSRVDVAALALAAEGVQMGTVFLTCQESMASRLHREALLGPRRWTYRLDEGIHWTARARHREPVVARIQRAGRRDFSLPAPAWARQGTVYRSGGRRPFGLAAAVGRPKRGSFGLH